MRVVLAILALIGALSSMPANAAIWTFGIQGVVTGQTRVIDMSFPPPFEQDFNESYVYSDIIQIDSFATTGAFHEVYAKSSCGNLPQHGQSSGYQYCIYSGTLSFAGNEIVGTNLAVEGSGNSCGGACGVITTLAAPKFSVTYLGNLGGPDPTSPVPESTIWTMMILGFGLVGGVLRRRHEIVPVWTRS